MCLPCPSETSTGQVCQILWEYDAFQLYALEGKLSVHMNLKFVLDWLRPSGYFVFAGTLTVFCSLFLGDKVLL